MMAMTRINYKSDFDFILKLVSCVKGDDGTVTKTEVGWPDHDWTATFWTSSKANTYVASRHGDVLTNCFNDNGQIHIVCNAHKLGVGELKCEFHAELPDAIYPDGARDLYEPQTIDIELVTGQGDCPTEMEAERSVAVVYRSVYEDAVQSGYQGTQEEYYTLLSQLPESVEVAQTLRQSVQDISAMVSDTAAGKAMLIDALDRQGYEVSEGASLIELSDAVDKGYLSALGYDCDEDYQILKEAIEQAAIAKTEFEANGGNLSKCGVFAPKVQASGAYLFQNNTSLIFVPLLDGLTSCAAMFGGCSALKSIPPLDLHNVTSTVGMFSRCSSLVSVPPLDLSNVTSATFMFRYCNALATVPPLDMPNVTTALNMFEDCYALTSVTINAPKLTDASYMFDYCSALTTVSLSAPSLTNASYMFQYCQALTTIPQFDMPKIANASYMFRNCTALTSASLDMPNATDASNMFYNCESLTSVTLNMPNVTTADYLFYNCKSLTSVTLNIPNATSISYMFQSCKALTEVWLNIPNVTTADYLFSYCSALTNATLITPNLTVVRFLFGNCSALTNATLDMGNVTTFSNPFYVCSKLHTLNITNLGKSSLTTYSLSAIPTWGSTETGRQSLIDTLITNSYDRAANGMSACKITLAASTKALLTDEELAAITAKGFTIA